MTRISLASDLIFTIQVGFTTVRPIVVDQHFGMVTVMASTANEAKLIAAQMIGSGGFRIPVEMVTSTKIVAVEI